MDETGRDVHAGLPSEGDTVRVNYTDESHLISLPRTTIGRVVQCEANAVRVKSFSARIYCQSFLARFVDIDLSIEDDRLVVYRSGGGERYGPVDELRNVTKRKRRLSRHSSNKDQNRVSIPRSR